MRLTVWGARGSIPTPMTTPELHDRLQEVLLRSKGVDLDDPIAVQRFVERLPPTLNWIVGGNTTCYEVKAGNTLIIFDMGSGMRLLGYKLMQEEFGRGAGKGHILMTHTHYDHIEGMPFFTPFFIPKNEFTIYSPYADMEERLRGLMRPPYFPVDFDYPASQRNFETLDPTQSYQIGEVEVAMMPLDHPGNAYAYRLTHQNRSLVFASDGEYKSMAQEDTQMYVDFFMNADALVFDAMYTYEDAVNNKMEWGHSTAKSGAELAWRAGVKRLILHHHDPISSEAELWKKVDDADHHLRFRADRAGEQHSVEVLLAYEGLTLDL